MVVFRSFMEIRRRRSGNPAATSRCSSVVMLQRRDIWSTVVKVKERPNIVTLRCFCDSCIIIIKRTGDLIFEIIEGCTDKELKMKQEQPERLKRLIFFVFSSQNH